MAEAHAPTRAQTRYRTGPLAQKVPVLCSRPTLRDHCESQKAMAERRLHDTANGQAEHHTQAGASAEDTKHRVAQACMASNASVRCAFSSLRAQALTGMTSSEPLPLSARRDARWPPGSAGGHVVLLRAGAKPRNSRRAVATMRTTRVCRSTSSLGRQKPRRVLLHRSVGSAAVRLCASTKVHHCNRGRHRGGCGCADVRGQLRGAEDGQRSSNGHQLHCQAPDKPAAQLPRPIGPDKRERRAGAQPQAPASGVVHEAVFDA